MTSLERDLRLSVELARCSPELRCYVQRLHLENLAYRRELGMRKLIDDLRVDEANLDASLPALLRPQA